MLTAPPQQRLLSRLAASGSCHVLPRRVSRPALPSRQPLPPLASSCECALCSWTAKGETDVQRSREQQAHLASKAHITAWAAFKARVAEELAEPAAGESRLSQAGAAEELLGTRLLRSKLEQRLLAENAELAQKLEEAEQRATLSERDARLARAGEATAQAGVAPALAYAKDALALLLQQQHAALDRKRTDEAVAALSHRVSGLEASVFGAFKARPFPTRASDRALTKNATQQGYHAEVLAAAYMRWLGYADAKANTGPTDMSDGGVDVRSSGALAQVKCMFTSGGIVGRTALAQLAGDALAQPGGRGKRLLFFAGSTNGYTPEAKAYAENVALVYPMALFTFDRLSCVAPANDAARGLVAIRVNRSISVDGAHLPKPKATARTWKKARKINMNTIIRFKIRSDEERYDQEVALVASLNVGG